MTSSPLSMCTSSTGRKEASCGQQEALWRQVRDRFFHITGPSKDALHLEALAQLIPFARTKDLHVLMDHLPNTLRTLSNHKSWTLADSVSAALAESAEELGSWRKTLLRSCIQWLAVSFSGREPEDENTQEHEKAMLVRLSELLHAVKEVDPGDWQQFVKTGLKFRYHDLTFLKTLLSATKLLYGPESSGRTKLVQLSVVHMMLTQHSLFLPTMLSSEEEETPDSGVKGDHALCPPAQWQYHLPAGSEVLPPFVFRV